MSGSYVPPEALLRLLMLTFIGTSLVQKALLDWRDSLLPVVQARLSAALLESIASNRAGQSVDMELIYVAVESLGMVPPTVDALPLCEAR